MLNLIKKILSPKRKLTDGDSQELQQKRLERALRIKKLISSPEWKDYIYLLDDYIEKALMRKVQTRIDIADQKTIDDLRLLDHEIFILQWAKVAPDDFVKKVEEKLNKENKKDEAN